MSTELAGKACSGCTACAEICPKHCITMRQNAEGFLYPEIDTSVCVECGMCRKTCPVLNKPVQSEIKTTAFAAYAKDEDIRLASSSGGIFSLLANDVIEHGGIVFGAAFDEKFNVHHIGVETEDDLDKLRGSKYVQSNLGNVFLEVKVALESGRPVLFSGVICQIAGLKAYLKKDFPNLLTVDVLCHGVPSPKLWRNYLEEQEKTHGGAVRRMFFRQKNFGWKTFAVSLEFSNETAYVQVFSKNPYMQMFLRNICLRSSCYDCHFNELDRLSDITLGDCWGVERIMPDMDDDKGTSVVLIHTERGRQQFERIRKEMVYRQDEPDRLLPPTYGGRKSVTPHPKREKFFLSLNNGESITELFKYVKPTVLSQTIRFVRRCAGKILHIMMLR